MVIGAVGSFAPTLPVSNAGPSSRVVQDGYLAPPKPVSAKRSRSALKASTNLEAKLPTRTQTALSDLRLGG